MALLELARVLPKNEPAAPVNAVSAERPQSPPRPQPATLTPQRDAFNLVLKARSLMDRWNYQASIEFFEKAIELDPQLSIAFNSREYAYLKLGDYPRAIQHFQTALKLTPTYENARVNLGVATNLVSAVHPPRHQ